MRTFLFWLLAFVLTASVAIYQRMTGPTYPLSGKTEFNGSSVEYKFKRSENVGTDCIVKVDVKDSLKGKLFWRRFKYDNEWNEVEMKLEGNSLVAKLPSQPPAGKLEYYVQISSDVELLNIPDDKTIVVRYKGPVPIYVLIPHVIAMFGAMLLSTRTGLEFFRKEPKLKRLTYWTMGFLFVGGLILGPIVQKFAFDAFWTGFPFGHDLTDNKTLIALIGWVIAFFMYKKSPNPKKWALFAAVLLLVIYLIPHSVLGSELDYSKLNKQQNNEIISE